MTGPLEQELYLISSKSATKHPSRKWVQLRELPRYPLILPSRTNANRMHIETQLAHLGLKPQIEYEIDGITSVLDLVHEGYGHAVPAPCLEEPDIAA
jgi:LysR family transcriptional regulator, nitrogen assimilation regulatory protein